MSADLQRFKALINKAAEGAGLTFAEASDAFSIMMSHFVGSTWPFRAVQDRICDALTRYRERSPSAE